LKVLLKEEMDLGIKLPRQGTSYILFINGKKYLQSGRVGVNRESFAPDRIFHYLPIFSKTKEIELLVSISNYTDVEGGFWSSLEFGNRKSIFKQKDSHWFRDIFISGIIFIMGIYHFSLFYLRKEDKSPLFFGIFCLIICLRALLTEERVILSLIENFNYRLSLSLEYLTMYLGIPTFLKFVHSLFPEELNLFINKGLSYISYFCASIVIFFSPIIFTQTLGTMQFIVVITIIFIIYSVIIALRKKKDGAGVILVGFSLFALTMINDVLHNRGIIQTGYYVSSGLVAFIFAQSYLLSARFSKAFTDAKEARRIAEEQRQLVQSAKEEIERLNRTKDEFLANLSHEIKTPLVTIYGYSELITQEEDLPESTKEYGAEIYKSAGMLNSYMDDVLLVTDLETNLQLDKKPYSLSELIESSLQPLEPLLREKEIQLSIPDLSGTTVICDSVLFGRAIGNILKNAIVYNKTGGTLILEVRQKGTIQEISIQDTGIGVESEYYEKIFDKFFRIDSSLSYEVSGVGLGLFLAKRILELHGGSISVKSEWGKSSEFLVVLPVN
jgi:two-component system, sensor histidine kinase ChiS